MDILFNGVGFNCDGPDFTAKTICEAIKSEGQGVKVVNETFFEISLLGHVSWSWLSVGGKFLSGSFPHSNMSWNLTWRISYQSLKRLSLIRFSFQEKHDGDWAIHSLSRHQWHSKLGSDYLCEWWQVRCWAFEGNFLYKYLITLECNRFGMEMNAIVLSEPTAQFFHPSWDRKRGCGHLRRTYACHSMRITFVNRLTMECPVLSIQSTSETLRWRIISSNLFLFEFAFAESTRKAMFLSRSSWWLPT